MKCPICSKDLVAWMGREDLDFRVCDNPNCEFGKCGHIATIDTWKALIDTKKKLDIAVDALKSAKTRLELINNSKFANLNNVLQIQSQCEVLKINKALEQIKDNDKDVKCLNRN